MLEAGARALHGRAAPARGLTLERVIYGSATEPNTNEPGASPATVARDNRTKDMTGEQET